MLCAVSLLGAGTPMLAHAGVGNAQGAVHAAEMAARMQPAEQQAVVQARPTGAGGSGLLAWPGVPRLGLPVLRMPDFSAPMQSGAGNASPMLPWLALAATWDPDLAHRAGTARARAEWQHGRAVVRVGGVDLLPSGRLQAGEDEVLSGTMAGVIGAGLLAGHVLPVFGSVVAEEQARADGTVPARAQPVPAARLASHSLLGVAMALEIAHGGAILCGGMAPCPTVTDLGAMVHDAWRFPGMVIAPPGGAGRSMKEDDADPAIAAVAAGVDMEQVAAGEDGHDVFGAVLRQAVQAGTIKSAQVQAMATHILASFYMAGSLDHPPPFASTRNASTPPGTNDTLVSDVEMEGAVLLQNENRVLPFDPALGPVLLLTRNAMRPAGDLLAAALRHAGLTVTTATVPDGPGASPPPAATQAARILMLTGSNDDNRLITTLADLGGHVAVVLTADDPDRQMPWLDMVDSVVQAWAWRDEYAQALAALLSGQQDFSGHLPVTLTGGFYPPGMADADYRAFASAHIVPLFPFGYGLSTRSHLTLGDLHVTREGNHLLASFSLTNPGDGPVRATPQLYVEMPPDMPGASRRLAGWRSIMVAPGHTVRLGVPVSLRLLGQWEQGSGNWNVAAGDYTLSLGFSSVMLLRHVTLHLPALHVPGALENAPLPGVAAE